MTEQASKRLAKGLRLLSISAVLMMYVYAFAGLGTAHEHLIHPPGQVKEGIWIGILFLAFCLPALMALVLGFVGRCYCLATPVARVPVILSLGFSVIGWASFSSSWQVFMPAVILLGPLFYLVFLGQLTRYLRCQVLTSALLDTLKWLGLGMLLVILTMAGTGVLQGDSRVIIDRDPVWNGLLQAVIIGIGVVATRSYTRGLAAGRRALLDAVPEERPPSIG